MAGATDGNITFITRQQARINGPVGLRLLSFELDRWLVARSFEEMRAAVQRARNILGQGFLAQRQIFVNEKAGGFADAEQSFDAVPLSPNRLRSTTASEVALRARSLLNFCGFCSTLGLFFRHPAFPGFPVRRVFPGERNRGNVVV